MFEQARWSITCAGCAVKAQMVLAGSRAALPSSPSAWIKKVAQHHDLYVINSISTGVEKVCVSYAGARFPVLDV